MTRPITRAQFLRLAALGAAGTALLAGCGAETGAPAPGASGGALRAVRRPQAGAGTPAGPVVALAGGADPAANATRAVAALGGMSAFVKRGDVVVVKPNICAARAPEYAATTNPDVVAALVRLALAAGAGEVLVMDYPLSRSAADAYGASGIGAAVTAAGGTVHEMSASGFRSYRLPGGLLGEQPVYGRAVDADVLITVPIAKQHGSTGLTLAGKNLMGLVGDRPIMHRLGLSAGIAELAAGLRPDLAVVDATRILVRNGPTGGNLDDVVRKDTVIASADWVAADACATGLFGMTPGDVPYLAAAAAMDLGTPDTRLMTIRRV